MSALDESEQNVQVDSGRRRTISPGALQSLLDQSEEQAPHDSDRRKTISPSALKRLLEDDQTSEMPAAVRRSPRLKHQGK
jgi:hypothetical protein